PECAAAGRCRRYRATACRGPGRRAGRYSAGAWLPRRSARRPWCTYLQKTARTSIGGRLRLRRRGLCAATAPSRQFTSGNASLQFEQVVELGEDEQETQLLVGPAQAHGLAALGGLALDQHQGAKTGAVDRARPRQIDHQAAGPLSEQVQHLPGRAAKHRAELDIEPLLT